MTVGGILGDPHYAELKQYILDHTGLEYYADKDEDLATRVSRRTSIRNAADCRAYLSMLAESLSGQTEMDCLVGELTIGETYFFRQRAHFDLLRETIVPDLLARNAGSRQMRIWSAGCATGAEPYSLSILLYRDFAAQIAGWDISILATDINVEFLARAREGKYAAWALRETPDETRDSCFIREGKQWLLRSEYRKTVEFQYRNLVNEGASGTDGCSFDLIVCRNVIIYFSREQMYRTVSEFHRRLEPGGWLLVGHAEPNVEMFQAFETVSRTDTTAYRKAAGQTNFSAPAVWQPSEIVWEPQIAKAREAEAEQTPVAAPVHDLTVHDLYDARVLADGGNWQAAIAATERMLAADPLNAEAHFTRGQILQNCGAQDEARDEFRRSIYLNRAFAIAHYHLGTSLESNQEREAARKAFRNVVQLLSDTVYDEPVPHGEGMTAGELVDLAQLHMELQTR